MPSFKSYAAITVLAAMGLFWINGMLSQETAATDAAAPSTQPATKPSAAEQATIRAIQCMNNLHEIGDGIVLYANDHDGAYPPDLGTLLIAEKMDMTGFICPVAQSSLPDHWQNMTPDQQSKWVNAHTDYVYLGAKWNMADFPQNAPLVYDKDDNHSDKSMNVLFYDGHVESLTLDEVHHRFGPKAGAERNTTRIALAPGQASPIPLITIDQAKAILARQCIGQLKGGLDEFEIDNGRFPTTKEGLNALVQKPAGDLPNWRRCIERLPSDPWGHPYVYTCPGSKSDFDLYSCGPDGKPGTDDDVK